MFTEKIHDNIIFEEKNGKKFQIFRIKIYFIAKGNFSLIKPTKFILQICSIP